MGLSFRVYGTNEAIPNVDEIIEFLEESEFEVTIESDDEEEEEWNELFVYEASLDEPVSLYRLTEEDGAEDEVETVLSHLTENGNGDESAKELRHTIENCMVIYGVDVPDEAEDDDNALVLSSLIVQLLAQKCDGIYCVDGEGFFNDAGDLIYELVEGE